MPLYDYCCTECLFYFEKRLVIAECDLPIEQPCPSCKALKVQKVISAPAIGDPVRIGVTKAPSDFQKYVLGRIKEAHPKGNVERSRSIVREI